MGHIMLYDPISPRKMPTSKLVKAYNVKRWDASSMMLEALYGMVLDSRKRMRPDKLLTGLQFRNLFYIVAMQVDNMVRTPTRPINSIRRVRRGQVAPFR